MLSIKNSRFLSGKSQLIFALVALLVLSLSFSCQKEDSGMVSSELTDDAQLIKAIQEASNKQSITEEQLPTASQNVLEQEYSESYVELAQMAPELGYKVDLMRERGSYIGERSQAYFNLDGRELRSDRGRNDRGGRDRDECFDFVYPMTLIMPDGSTLTGNSEEELWLAVRNWYAANPAVREKPAIQYPVDIIFKEDSTIVTINNDEEMRGAYAKCEQGRELGFEFVYPITYIMPDGSTITGNSKEELDIAIRNWYAANPGVKEKPALQYPVQVVLKDGTVLTINNEEEMRALIARLGGDPKGNELGFEFVYPITYIMPDGSTITGNSKEELDIAIRNWYAANPGVREEPVLQYPVQVVLKDGTVLTINNEEEMRELIWRLGGGG
jgi:hypothetical protein